MVNFKLFTGSLFQFSSVMAVPAVEESIGVSTIGSEASTGNWTPASRTGATIQSRITGEKFHGNFPPARLDDFTYDRPGSHVKCTTAPLPVVRRTIAGEPSPKWTITAPLGESASVSRGPQAIACMEPACTFPTALTDSRFGMSSRSRSGLWLPLRPAIMPDGSSYRSAAPAFEIETRVPPRSTHLDSSL